MMSSMAHETNISEILYKLGGLETSVKEGMRRVEDTIKEVKEELKTNKQELDKEIKLLEERVSGLEDFKKEIVTKFSVIVAGIVGFWAVFGDSLSHGLLKVLGL